MSIPGHARRKPNAGARLKRHLRNIKNSLKKQINVLNVLMLVDSILY